LCSGLQYKNYTGFGQDFLAKHLLGWPTDGASHDAVGDAVKSLRLFKLHQQLSADGERLAQTQARDWPRAVTAESGKQHQCDARTPTQHVALG
jgi:hypothetical protein